MLWKHSSLLSSETRGAFQEFIDRYGFKGDINQYFTDDDLLRIKEEKFMTRKLTIADMRKVLL